MKYCKMKFVNLAAAAILICAASFPLAAGDKETYGNPDLMVNVYGRDFQLLNGKWDAIIDLYDQGRGKRSGRTASQRKRTSFSSIRSTAGSVLTFRAISTANSLSSNTMKVQSGMPGTSRPKAFRPERNCISISVR